MAISLGQWTLALDGSELPAVELIGGKAWSIARMLHLGLNVPPAVVITTEACAHYLEHGAVPDSLAAEIDRAIEWLEQRSGRIFGGEQSPLLVSVRSGAAVSMPGMMDTVLNLGINEQTEHALANASNAPRFARDTHRRFIELYAQVVLKLTVPALDADDDPIRWYDAVSAAGSEVPSSVRTQLKDAVVAVFESSNSRRAKRYRKHHGLPDNLGTAVTIQAMVFGNLDDRSGTGVLFSRNPLTGDRAPYGEFLHRAQGEDVVSGKFTPQPLASLCDSAPQVYDELLNAAAILEKAACDVQDIEFTVQQGELFLLQTRAAKRGPRAAVRFAVDMVDDGLIDRDTALARVSAEQIRTLLQPRLSEAVSAVAETLASGEPACQGVGRGKVVLSADDAEREAANGHEVVLARPTTSPEDVHGMIAAAAVITDQGGATSHAAVVSRALGVPCVVGCGSEQAAALNGAAVTVDGAAGKVYAGLLDVVTPAEDDDEALAELIRWAESRTQVDVISLHAPLPSPVVDLNALDGGEDPDNFSRLIKPGDVVVGKALDSDAGVEAALAAGASGIVCTHRLPALLGAFHRASGSGES